MTIKSVFPADGGIPLKEWAEKNGLTPSQARYLRNSGRIIGAQKMHGGKWVVFPPGTIRESNYKW